MTGTTALNIDTADRLSAALPRYALVVVGLAFVLLTVVFRSVAGAAEGGRRASCSASPRRWAWSSGSSRTATSPELFDVARPEPILSFLPVLLIGILFGLAMDYEVFLVSRMREHFVRTGRGA